MTIEPTSIPTLRTERLVLRPFVLDDAPRVQLLAGAWEVADTMAGIPHPYPDGAAEQWIAGHAQAFRDGSNAPFAVCLASGELVGTVSLMGFGSEHRRAELGYWVGVEYWGKGYCTEAVRELVRYGFDTLGLNRVFGQHLKRNPASGRVMAKAGLRHEGTLRRHFFRWGRFGDVELWGVLADEWRR